MTHPSVTPAQLRTLIAVAETGSVHGAAERLVVTPSAISASTGALQAALGVALLRRDGRGIRLTDAGRTYLDYAYQVLGLLDEARRAAAGEVDPECGAVRIGAVTSAGEHVVPGVLAAFCARYPDADVELEVDNQERLRALFARNELDLVIGGRPGPDGVALGSRPNELIVVAPAKLAVAAGADIGVDWLGRQTWLLRGRGSKTRISTRSLLTALELSPATLTMGSNGAVLRSVLLGLGVTLVSRDGVRTELAAGSLVEVPTPETPMHRPLYLVAHRGRLPQTARLMVRVALETGTFSPVCDIGPR